MQDKQTYRKIIVNFMIMSAIFVLAIIFIPRLLSFFWPFVLALILSLIANPVVEFMEQRIRIKREHGSAIIIIFVIVMLLLLIYFVGYLLIKEAIRLIADFPIILDTINDLLDRLMERLKEVTNISPDKIRAFFDEITSSTNEWIQSLIDRANNLTFKQASGYIKSIGNAFFMLIITILSTYFFITNRSILAEKVEKLLPKSVVSSMDLVTMNFKMAIMGYIKAQIKIMMILILLMFTVFLILQTKYAFFLAILIGVIDLLPVFGTGLVFWPWAILDFINNNYVRAIIILGLYLACQIIKQILQPKMVGDSVKLNPFAAIIFMFIGYQLKGIIGMIVAIPLGMILISFFKIGMFDRILRGFQILFHDINEYRKF